MLDRARRCGYRDRRSFPMADNGANDLQGDLPNTKVFGQGAV
jgi:hypothetical protein